MLTGGVSVIYNSLGTIIAYKGLCTLLISSLHYNILYLLSGLFINEIIYLQLRVKSQVTKGCKTQVNTQLLISQEVT